MTKRLYYEDSYVRTFEAEVIECTEKADGVFLIRLDESAFYPTSGGQPYDTGTLGGGQILNVYADEAGEVWHEADKKLTAGDRVKCEIDWARRFDHMQQHAGEHMLAGAVHRLLKGVTIGLHLGKDDSSIDVSLPGGRTNITEAEIRMLEDDVNRHIQADVPIKCYFPDEETLLRLPLRKPPTVTENVRIVQIGDDEYCACGGTHPSSAGQVGLVKIIDARPSRGKMRLTFLCGMRAFRDYRNRFDELERAAQSLSTGWENLHASVEALNARMKDAEYHLRQEKKAAALKTLSSGYENAARLGSVRAGQHVFDGLGMEGLREAASEFIKENGRIALFADRTDSGVLLLFARSADVDIHIGKVLTDAAKAFGGKGGGKSDFAQGAAQSADALAFALTQIQTVFDKI